MQQPRWWWEGFAHTGGANGGKEVAICAKFLTQLFYATVPAKDIALWGQYAMTHKPMPQ
jgi:hypothetical protein